MRPPPSPPSLLPSTAIQFQKSSSAQAAPFCSLPLAQLRWPAACSGGAGRWRRAIVAVLLLLVLGRWQQSGCPAVGRRRALARPAGRLSLSYILTFAWRPSPSPILMFSLRSGSSLVSCRGSLSPPHLSHALCSALPFPPCFKLLQQQQHCSSGSTSGSSRTGPNQ